MAGEWLKFECSLPEKPETLAITVAMGWEDPDLTVGKLMRAFRWFDQHTIDGNAPGVTSALLDRIIGVTGFAQAMADAKWLVITPAGLSLHNFDRHNGATAKSRSQTAKRVANHRGGNGESNAATVTPALAREEKRREEKIDTPPTVVARATRKCPPDFEITPAMQEWANTEVPGVNLVASTAMFRDHTFKTAMTDWAGAWRNWLRKDFKDRPKARGSPAEPAWRVEQRQRVRDAAPGVAAKTYEPADAADFFLDVEARNVTTPQLG